ncbi:MAG: hypothetical protein A2X64_07590 [Ignavibacteria bacterium GWF2_33_9]|nr:MAG: hypothetical protein A2X64_07590 [Ignavibacteria bacterium GWF2_33_9]
MLSIGITTFKRRLDLVKNLITQIRSFDENIDILITINADNEEAFDEKYRKSLLEFLTTVKNTYPIFFPSFTGLSKMWNTLIVHSPTDHILVLNDDIRFENSQIIPSIKSAITAIKQDIDPAKELLILNNSWSHFVISKQIAHKLKYFDERLIAFGEEDGDMYWRFINTFKAFPSQISIDGISNISEGRDICASNIETTMLCGTQRPIFNTKFIYDYKYKKSFLGIKGMFNYTSKCISKTVQQYPYEKFKRDNKHNIKNFKEITKD